MECGGFFLFNISNVISKLILTTIENKIIMLGGMKMFAIGEAKSQVFNGI